MCNKCKSSKRMHRGTLLCSACYQKQNERLKTRLRNVETYNEDRLLFLARKSKELGLKHTLQDIKNMIHRGYTDQLILKTESWDVWTLGSEPSKALPFINNNEVRL